LEEHVPFLHTVKAPQSLFLIPLLLSNLLGPPANAQPPSGGLQLLIVEGDGAINNVKQRVNRETIVQVEDENHKPVAGAAVIFFLPNQGPGGTFPNGSTTLTTTTNAEGQAVARGIRYNQQSGPMQLRITASFAGQTASLIVNQTNVIGTAAGGGSSSAGMSAGTKWLIIAAIAGGAAAAGIVAGTHGGGSSATPTPTVIITPGTPTVGGPQ
jgi:hypothetical protein